MALKVLQYCDHKLLIDKKGFKNYCQSGPLCRPAGNGQQPPQRGGRVGLRVRHLHRQPEELGHLGGAVRRLLQRGPDNAGVDVIQLLLAVTDERFGGRHYRGG